MERVLKKFDSFSDCERHEIDYWKSVDPDTKLEVLESIRAMQMEMRGEGQRGFQRVLKVVERS